MVPTARVELALSCGLPVLSRVNLPFFYVGELAERTGIEPVCPRGQPVFQTGVNTKLTSSPW